MSNSRVVADLKKIAGMDNVKVSEPMRSHTTFRIGGPADYFVTPQSTEHIQQIVKYLKNRHIPYYIIGNGSNLLVSDNGYRGVIMQLYSRYSGYEFLHDDVKSAADKAGIVYIKVQSGMGMMRLAALAAEYSLEGMEFASGIPGSVGGGIMMNAGAYGGEMKDIVVRATVMDEDGNVRELDNRELEFGYRTSRVAAERLIVLEAVIALRPGNQKAIREKMQEIAQSRRDKQPLEYPSAGSTFKRPQGYFAGKLIADAGLKGFTVGGAKVSEKHAGFVVNTGRATAGDVIELTNQIADKIYQLYGVKLELEVKKLGFDER